MARSFEKKIHTFLGLHQVEEGLTLLKEGESPKMKNLKVTPSYTLTLREGYECIEEKEGIPRGIKYFKDSLFYVLSDTVYKRTDGESIEIGKLESDKGEVNFLEFDESLYFLDGVKIKVWKDTFGDIEAYVPLVAISTDYMGSGTAFEEINLLTPKRRQSFTLEDGQRTMPLCEKDIVSVEAVKLFGEVIDKKNYTVDTENGVVTLSSSDSSDPNAYEVTYVAKSDTRLIHSMRYATLWGGDNDTRIFLWGDRENPAIYRYSGVHDGISGMEYFPELSFNKTLSGSKVTSLLRHYDRLLIFTENDAYYSYIETSSDANGMNYLSFPVRTLSSVIGCSKEGCATLTLNTPVTFFNSTLYRWVSTSIRDERNAEDIGERIKTGLKELSEKGIKIFDRESTSEIYLYSEDKMYVYNYALDLFYYYEGIGGVCFAEGPQGEVYFQKDDGRLCKFNESDFDIDKRIQFYWESDYDTVAGLENKNIHSIAFELLPVSTTSFDIMWVTDRATSVARKVGLDYKIFDFGSLFFDLFSFKTAVTPVKLKKRVKLKRCKGFKLILSSDENSGDFHLLSLALSGIISDAK